MKRIISLMLILLLLPLAGCGAAAEEVSVMATFYPVYILAENVLENVEGVTLSSMTPPSTGCLHDYQLLTSDMRALAKAQALLINGAGMESFLPDVESQFPNLKVIDCSQGVELLEEGETEEKHHDHGHGEYNAHIQSTASGQLLQVRRVCALHLLYESAVAKVGPYQAEVSLEFPSGHAELQPALCGIGLRPCLLYAERAPHVRKSIHGCRGHGGLYAVPDPAAF